MCPTDCIEQETLKDQEFEDAIEAVTYKLVAHLFCSDSKCTNYRQSCYITPKGAVHQAVDSRSIRLWSRAITRKKASLEAPSVNIVLKPLD